MGFEPVVAEAEFDVDGDGELNGGFHFLFDEREDVAFFGDKEIEEQFVVDLEEHAGFEMAAGQFGGKIGHGDFDHGGGGGLDGGGNGIGFGGAARGGLGGTDV